MQPSLSPEMRQSIDSIKAELGEGKVVCRSRQTGKTAALLEYIHENGRGLVDVFTCNANQKHYLECAYKERFPEDEQPRFFSIQSAMNARVAGTTGRKWATDEVWPESVVRRASDYEYITFLGGVGTPMCMDLNS